MDIGHKSESPADRTRYNSPAVAKTILAGGGFNWTLIDAEHGQITDADYFTVSMAQTSIEAR